MNLMPSIKNKFRTEFESEFEKGTLKPKTVLEILALLLDLLTSRAFERVPRLWARSAISYKRRARVSEREVQESESALDQKTKRTTLRKSTLLHEKIKRNVCLTLDIYTKNWAVNKNVLYSSFKSENVVEYFFLH